MILANEYVRRKMRRSLTEIQQKTDHKATQSYLRIAHLFLFFFQCPSTASLKFPSNEIFY